MVSEGGFIFISLLIGIGVGGLIGYNAGKASAINKIQLPAPKSGIVEYYKQQEMDREIRQLERENILLERENYMKLFDDMRKELNIARDKNEKQ